MKITVEVKNTTCDGRTENGNFTPCNKEAKFAMSTEIYPGLLFCGEEHKHPGMISITDFIQNLVDKKFGDKIFLPEMQEGKVLLDEEKKEISRLLSILGFSLEHDAITNIKQNAALLYADNKIGVSIVFRLLPEIYCHSSNYWLGQNHGLGWLDKNTCRS